MSILLSIPMLLFMAAQGGVVFMTARWGLRWLEISHWSGKIAAMAISYIAWIAFTITAYMLGGGEGGMMDGGLFVLMLCFSALISSFVYLLVWLFMPTPTALDPEDEIMIEPRASLDRS